MRLWYWLGRQLRRLPAIATPIDRERAGSVWLHRSVNWDVVGCCYGAPPHGAAVK
jgi:hypothetical protein